MKWINASERLPVEEKKNYIFRQAGNTRSSRTVWYQHAVDYGVSEYLSLPIERIEWLDESDPSNPVVDEGWISECKEVIELLLKRNRELYSFADMPWEDYSGQNAVVRGEEFVNRKESKTK